MSYGETYKLSLKIFYGFIAVLVLVLVLAFSFIDPVKLATGNYNVGVQYAILGLGLAVLITGIANFGIGLRFAISGEQCM